MTLCVSVELGKSVWFTNVEEVTQAELWGVGGHRDTWTVSPPGRHQLPVVNHWLRSSYSSTAVHSNVILICLFTSKDLLGHNRLVSQGIWNYCECSLHTHLIGSTSLRSLPIRYSSWYHWNHMNNWACEVEIKECEVLMSWTAWNTICSKYPTWTPACWSPLTCLDACSISSA